MVELSFDDCSRPTTTHILAAMNAVDATKLSKRAELDRRLRFVTPQGVTRASQWTMQDQQAPIRKRKWASIAQGDCPCIYGRIKRALRHAECDLQCANQMPHNTDKILSFLELSRGSRTIYDRKMQAQIQSKARPSHLLHEHSMSILATSTALAYISRTENGIHDDNADNVKEASLEFGPLL